MLGLIALIYLSIHGRVGIIVKHQKGERILTVKYLK